MLLATAVVVVALMVAAPSRARREPSLTVMSAGDLARAVSLVAGGLAGLTGEIDERLQRLRAMSALADYQAHRREAERCGERCERTGCRIRHRPIRISAACLENPLARACM